ncbi:MULTISPECIES: hypothetical protein [Rhizobium]|uniref:Uncharacterized protein n=1 Tax=Rhizobium changzhiense TaxID=2692317 RepID=A0A7Z0RK81_9HYPH|nr:MULTISPECIES: hypothetical protein [Rhizobium]MBA5803191.1 hypothetical protein [Rhizobium changzhiense]MCH4546809.1 hypothetical protein [Rhizobium changzhiense]MCV9942964.1 hypothetical protein [Rhizobium sp. BT-175]MCW0015076.1 hypothetical protein [Rhizobium sp. BT-226]NNU47528.1 hypothetical protein [Rhizobium changzhiense]
MFILYESAKAIGNASPARKPGTCFKHIAVLLIHLSKLLVELGLRPGVPADLSFQNRFLRRPAAAGG